MSEAVQVEAARIPDRDRLLSELLDAGLDAHAVDEVCIEVLCDESESGCDDVLRHAESVIVSIGAPFVPLNHDGVIYIRPPVS